MLPVAARSVFLLLLLYWRVLIGIRVSLESNIYALAPVILQILVKQVFLRCPRMVSSSDFTQSWVASGTHHSLPAH